MCEHLQGHVNCTAHVTCVPQENTYPENNARISEMNSILEEMEKVEKEEELELAVKLRQVEEEIQRKTEVLEEEQKDSLLENLHSYLDPKSLAEIRDNGWLHREISAQRVAYERLLEETSKLETGNLELMDDLLRSSESESRESLTLPVVVDTTRIPSASVGSQTVSGTGRAPLASKDSRKSVSEQQAKLHSQKIQSWEDDSLEPLGLRELRRLRIKGKSPHRQGTSRPQTQHDIRLPPLMGEDGEEHRPESRTRKKTWPVTASMLRAIV